jgi:hypothetical protein
MLLVIARFENQIDVVFDFALPIRLMLFINYSESGLILDHSNASSKNQTKQAIFY